MSAENAGLKDDEATPVIDALRKGQRVTRHAAAYEVAFATGAVQIEALRAERTRAVADELRAERFTRFKAGHRETVDALAARAIDGVVFVLSGLGGAEGAVARELFSGIAIGVAVRYDGILVDGDAVWDPAARKWYS